MPSRAMGRRADDPAVLVLRQCARRMPLLQRALMVRAAAEQAAPQHGGHQHRSRQRRHHQRGGRQREVMGTAAHALEGLAAEVAWDLQHQVVTKEHAAMFVAPKDERRTPRSMFVLPQGQRRTPRSTFGVPQERESISVVSVRVSATDARGPGRAPPRSVGQDARAVFWQLLLSLLRVDRGPGPVHGVSRT